MNFLNPPALQQYKHQLKVQNVKKTHNLEETKRNNAINQLNSKVNKFNPPLVCQGCIRKEQQIQTLIVALRILRNQKNAENFFSQNHSKQAILQAVSEKTRNHSQIPTSFPPRQKSIQFFQQMQNLSKNNQAQLSRQSTQMDIQSIRSVNLKYLREIEILKKKVEFFKEKMEELAASNNLLKKEILQRYQRPKTVYKNSNIPSRFLQPYKKPEHHTQYCKNPQEKKGPAFSSLRNNVIKNDSLLNPQQISLSPFDLHRRNHKYGEVQANCDCSHYHLPQQKSITDRQHSFSRRQKSRSSDIVGQKRKSVDDRIKMLEDENKKLRTQVYFNHF